MPPCESIPCRKKLARPAFSLTELLAVMAILMTLGGIAVSIGLGSSLNAGQSSRQLVRACIQQARAHAIASRNATALIIPTENNAKTGGQRMSFIEVKMENNRFIPMVNERGETIKESKWVKLLDNYHFVSNKMIGLEGPTIIDHQMTLSIVERNAEVQCHMIVFGPNGQIIHPSPGTPLRIAMATVNGSGIKARVLKNTDQVALYDMLQINRFTGHTKRITP